ncbi:MAG: cache domain-containing protein [Gammaproteobacteria bacterium]|nr:cache domain-containing protein [Gammaproteobacteria bacterium]
MSNIARFLVRLLLAGFTLLAVTPLLAGDITSKMQPNIDRYKKQAVAWAADPLIVQAVKEINAKGPIPGMGNAKWREIKDTDPVVQGFITNPAGQLLTKWMNADAKGINKIVLSGAKSERVAFTSMPAVYLGKGKPNFDEAIDGKVWQQPESKPDPSTNIDTVQIAAPVKDGGEVIGVLLVSLTAENLAK